MNRHLSRTIAMQSIYEVDFRSNADIDEIIRRNIEAYQEDADGEYINRVVRGAIEHADEIDASISRVAPEWPVDQISAIDKAVLRLAIFELLYDNEVPPKVCINEAVELGKTFGSDSTSRFVNGVLGTLYRSSERYNPDDDLPKADEEGTISHDRDQDKKGEEGKKDDDTQAK